MIGQTYFIGNRMYLQVNDQGTLEGLPEIKCFAQIKLYIKTRFKKMTIAEVREYAFKHKVPVTFRRPE